MGGWVKLHRCLINKPIFDNANLLKVWIWCLCKATHSEHDQLVGLQKVKLTPGQFIFGRIKAAEELNIPQSTVWRLMTFLKDNESLDIKTNNKYSIITIDNWASYQADTNKTDNKVDNERTTDGQQMDTNKNVKTVKNVKKYTYSMLHSQLAERLVDKITLNNNNFKQPSNMDSWSNEIRLMMDNDKRTVRQIESVIDWCQKDPFWQSNILSVKKLREKFDQLEIKMKLSIYPIKGQAEQPKTVMDKAKEAAERYAIRHGITTSNSNERSISVIEERH